MGCIKLNYYKSGSNRDIDYFKKVFIIFSIIIITLIFFTVTVLADDEIEDVDDNEVWSTNSNTTVSFPDTYSKHIICIERTTATVLFEKDAYTKTPMASTTKIMTAIIVLENCDLNEEVEISKKAANTGGSTLGITAGTKMTLESLMYGLLLRSGNDCAVAIAEHVGGDVEGFAKLMNDKAKELGLVNTNFVTPHGLDNDNHYTTAYDLAILTNYALNNEKFREIVGTKNTTIMVGNYARSINNTNELLGNVDGVYGVKTGFTGNSGRCLVTACKRGNLDIIIVVLGADTKKIRGLDTKKIIDYVFSNYEMIDTYELLQNSFKDFEKIKKIKAYKSLDNVSLKLTENYTYTYPIEKGKVNELKTSLYCVSLVSFEAPKNSVLGKINFKCGENILYSVNIELNNELKRTTWKDYLKIFICNFKKYF